WSPWKRSHREYLAKVFSKDGRRVIVVENGWLSPINGTDFFQIAEGGWNGTGRFRSGAPDRWHSWYAREMPWRTHPGYELVIGQRGHPFDDRTARPDWHLRLDLGDSPVVRRARDTLTPLAADLSGAAACHVWSSNAASHAVLAGVPVVQHGPNLMVGALASRPGEPLYFGPRTHEFERLAWAQWSRSEISSGLPFARMSAI
ncbi:MAG: hypothetical protein KGL35_18930, partial [Bradyrhizobium sp.]|nr:hypothetical protein [Bradyrhizobium sp.]